MSLFENLTWRCSICGEERQDEFISVVRYDFSASINQPPGTYMWNIKYCNDREPCRTKAHNRAYIVAQSMPEDA